MTASPYSDRARQRLRDIVENVDRIADYIRGMTLGAFQRDTRTADAVERCLQRITGAVIQLGEADTDRSALGVAWSEVRSLGNRLRHEYRRIDRGIIYQTALSDLPPLRDAAAGALGE